MCGLLQPCGHFHEQSCRFSIVCVMFRIPKGVTSLCFLALWELFLTNRPHFSIVSVMCTLIGHKMFKTQVDPQAEGKWVHSVQSICVL